MSKPTFIDTHNLAALLEKPTESERFELIIDFLNAKPVKYALTVNPTIFAPCAKQFSYIAKVKKVNGKDQIQALVDKQKVIIMEDIIRCDLHFDDAKSTACLPNATIFEELVRTGAKTTAWNEFSSTMECAIICLANNHKFNFSKYILDNIVKNLEGEVKFFMFPRFLQASLDKQVIDLEIAKTTQAKEITKLKKRDDVSKQGRSIEEIDQNAESALVDEAQDRIHDTDMFGVDDLEGNEVILDVTEKTTKKEVSIANPVTTAGEVVTTANVEVSVAHTTTTIADVDDEITLAKTLIAIKAAKPKVITTAATIVTTAITTLRGTGA
ncbi:hypothetical protein Tco_0060085 [Tanacetum coccineum]